MRIYSCLLKLLFLASLSLNLSSVYGNECCCAEQRYGHIFTLAPEFYQTKRIRKGGTEQNGNIIGIRFNYDHIRRYKIYWGLQAFYGTGELRGKNLQGDRLHSRLTDEQVELLFGYTFAYKHSPFYSFTPFFGAGHFWETNQFHRPTPLKIKLCTDFWYGAFGFLSHMKFGSCWSVGLNARFKLLWESKCKVSKDPFHPNLKQQVGDRIHYRIELPIVYTHPIFCTSMRLGLMPFYEYRIYGGRENYPFDFFETKYRIYGLDLQFIYEY